MAGGKKLLPGNAFAFEDIDEAVMLAGYWDDAFGVLQNLDVYIKRRSSNPFDGTIGAVHGARHHAQRGAVFGRSRRYRLGRDVLIARGGHLVSGGQVHPDLKTPHETVLLHRHLGMHDTAPRRHPLNAPRPELAAVAFVVFMPHRAREHIGHGLEPAVWVIGKAGDVVGALRGLELVEKKERIEIVELRGPDSAANAHARTLERFLRADDLSNIAIFHRSLL